jgi:hypothetical protein
MAREKNQVEKDTHEAWVLAANCLLYEADGGPDVNLGTDSEPEVISHAEAVQISYAHNLILECDGDLERIQAAGRASQQAAADHQSNHPKRAREDARAADLCERSAQMVLDAGAAGDDRNRRRLLAYCTYTTTASALGAMVPSVAEDAQRVYEQTLRDIDAEPDPDEGVPDEVRFKGPTYDPATGRFRIGEGADGAVAQWRLNTPGTGMEHGLILGPEQIGKSNVLRIVLVEASVQPKFAIWMADPTDRHHFPGFLEGIAAKVATNHRDSILLLREAVRVIDSRTKRGRFPDPTPQRQGILIVLEDAHQLFADDIDATRLAERIVTDGGPVSVALIATAPDTDLAHFGGSLTLRSGLAKTNRMPMGSNAPHMIDVLQQAD